MEIYKLKIGDEIELKSAHHDYFENNNINTTIEKIYYNSKHKPYKFKLLIKQIHPLSKKLMLHNLYVFSNKMKKEFTLSKKQLRNNILEELLK